MEKISLNGQWSMKATEDQEWLPATVPGSVMHDLLQLGKIDDPFYRDNEKYAYDIAAKDYLYKRDFQVTQSFLEQDHIFLRCEAVDTLSTIMINDQEVASTDNMHRTYEMDVKPFLQEGTNTIQVMLFSPVNYISEKHRQQPLDGVEHAIEGYQYMRKTHSMFGWDWGPQIPDLGIWRDITLIGWSQAKIADLYIKQNHDDEHVELDIQIQLEKETNLEVAIDVVITSPDGNETINRVQSSRQKESVALKINNPQLWWPNGLGEQALYDVEVILHAGGKRLDGKQLKIGLRTIELRHESDQWGKSFEFLVNGVRFFAKGANYIPEDSLLARMSPERTEQLIQDSVEANFNMIRVWGGGYYPDDYFYDLCDRYGLIVWQDFMFACSVYDVTKEFEHSVRMEAIDNIKRIRHHASLGLWCGNNEVEEAWEFWGWPKKSKHRTGYLKLFEMMLPELIEELDPQTDYWSSSPSSGGSFVNPKDPNVGDVHYWDVWHGLKPFTEYRKFHFRFCSEFGFQSFPSLKTVKTFTEPEDRNVFSYVMERHQKNGSANGKILSYLADTFKYPKNFDQLLYVSQLLQGEAIKYGVEHWRRNIGRSMGSLYWQLNDCWPVASWSSIDYFGRWKALHYFAKRFYAPVLLSIEEEGTTAALYITNDTLNPIRGTIDWKLRTNQGEILKEGILTHEVQSMSAAKCETLSFDSLDSDKMRETYFEAALYIDEKEISRTTILFTQPKHFQFTDPNIQWEVNEGSNQYDITLTAAAFAKYVELDLDNADGKFSDNYFDLSPGVKKSITVKKDSLSEALDLEGLKAQLKVRSLYDSFE